MAQIRMLSENVIGKIAAGEVVERPAAAIKELVENSLDAGATMILVDIQEGGIVSFRVSDNGCGIDQSDIRMAFERHATSKIRKEEDLNSVGTLGFRGEALASIAAVGRVTMITRTAKDETGLRVRNEGGQILSIQETACSVGTTITVKDLFFNVPVRKGFLKKPQTEAGAVSDIMMRFILSRPDVSFRYSSNGRMVYQSPGDGKTESAMLSIYGSRAVRSMREVKGNSGGVLVRGMVGVGENARSSRSNESFFINGRMMRSPLLSGALEDACRERVMIGKYPICALYLDMPYESVNVNVHPNKLEVRFRDDQAVRRAVFAAVFDALRDNDAFEHPVEISLRSEKEQREELQIPVSAAGRIPVTVTTEEQAPTISAPGGKPVPDFRPIAGSAPMNPRAEVPSGSSMPGGTGTNNSPTYGLSGLSMSGGTGSINSASPQPEEKDIETPRDAADNNALFRENGTAYRNAEAVDTGNIGRDAGSANTGVPEEAEQLTMLTEKPPKPMKIFGAVFNTFILIEYEDNLLLVDQHAVHERLLFEKLMKRYEGQQGGQELLVPIIVSVTRHEQQILDENRELLQAIGMTIEPFGEQDVAIRSVPVVLGENESEMFLREAIAELEAGREPGADKKRAAILQMACKHAVKGGEPLSESDLRYLVEQMIDQKVTPTCPHGRPLVVSISHVELDKKFKRIQ